LSLEKCAFCGKYVFKAYVCPYCGKKFCFEHRAPDKHNCKWDLFRLKENIRKKFLRDKIHQLVTKVINPKLVKFPLSFIEEIRSELIDEFWYVNNVEELCKLLRMLPKFYLLLPEEHKELFRKLLLSIDDYVFKEIGYKLNLRKSLRTFKLTVKVMDEKGEVFQECIVSLLFNGNFICNLSNEEGITTFNLLKGTYIIEAYKAGKDWYVYGKKVVHIIDKDVNIDVIVTRKKWRPPERVFRRIRILTLPIEIPLPSLPPLWSMFIDIHEKYMQMALAGQLRYLGTFVNEKIVDVRHSFTGFKRMSPYFNPTLRPLIVPNEMDILILTENNKLIGLELKSKKGLERGDIGIEQACRYYEYGIEYVYLVHREVDWINPQIIIDQIKRLCPTLGYAIYSPGKLKILKLAELNPYIYRDDVRKRGEFIKKNFNKAGGTSGPYGS